MLLNFVGKSPPPLLRRNCITVALTFSVASMIAFMFYWQVSPNDIDQVVTKKQNFDNLSELLKWQEDELLEMDNDPDAVTEETQFKTLIPQKKVVIGAVSCRNVTSPNTMMYNEETVVMLKSVLISAMLYNITNVELHLFLEHKEDEEFFYREFQEMGYFSRDTVNIQGFTHPAVVDTIPVEHRDHMIYHPRYRCGYTRFFFPLALPFVDSIIHLDSDMIITGSLWEIWSQFAQFDNSQLIGAARSNEANDLNHLPMYQRWFGDIPHPPPRGVNAGLLLMNLTRMREYQWEKMFLQTYEYYYKRVNLTGQRTVNCLMGNDLKILKMLSCQFNFCHRHCDKGFVCSDAMGRGGIHMIHGNGNKMKEGEIFYALFKAYRDFNVTELPNKSHNELTIFLKNNLMHPMRLFYNQSMSCSQCYANLYQGLFLDFP